MQIVHPTRHLLEGRALLCGGRLCLRGGFFSPVAVLQISSPHPGCVHRLPRGSLGPFLPEQMVGF